MKIATVSEDGITISQHFGGPPYVVVTVVLHKQDTRAWLRLFQIARFF